MDGMTRQLRHWFRHYFTPHETNNWRAKTLHPYALGVYILMLVVLQGSMGWLSGFGPGILGYATDISIDRVLQLVNAERKQANLSPLTLNQQLSSAATGKAQDMFAKDYWAHVSPSGTTPWSFITNAGYQYIYAGENLAKSFNTSDEVVRAWMNSPTHRANIMKPEYKEIGLAVMNGKLRGEETTLVVQEFGTRTSTTDMAQQPVAAVSPTTVPVQVASAQDVQPTVGPTGLDVPQQQQQDVVTAQAPIVVSAATSRNSMPFGLSKTVSVLAVEILLFILCLDALYIWRHRTVRVGSHTLAHIIFFLALLGAMGAAGAGAIL